MFPSQTQRVLMVVAVVAGVWPCAWGLSRGLGGMMVWGDGGAAGVVWLVVGVLPAVGLAVGVAACGNPLSGVWTLALTLTVAGVMAGDGGALGGGMAAALRRAVLGGEGWGASGGAGGSGGSAGAVYIRMMVGAAGWGLAWVVALGVVGWGADRVRGAVPRRLQSRHGGGGGGGGGGLLPGGAGWGVGWDTGRWWTAAGEAVVAAGVSGLLTVVLVRSAEPGQVVGGLVVAFAVGGLIGRMVLPVEGAAGVVVAPVLVALGGYAVAWIGQRGAGAGTGEGGRALLAALYGGELPGPALALPWHYLSAGVLGGATGLGLAQVLERAKGRAVAGGG